VTTPIALADCPGLIHLMLTGDEDGPSFTLNGVQCVVERVESHATFEAVGPDFGLSVIYPGWYSGEHGAPAHIIIVGDAHTCLQWLPIERADKLALIARLPLGAIDQTLCRVAA
jgi:hypothetical protein